MRILFTTFAWPSHYFAQVPLAWACRLCGLESAANFFGLQGE